MITKEILLDFHEIMIFLKSKGIVGVCQKLR